MVVKKRGAECPHTTFTGANKNDLHEGVMGGAPQITGPSAAAWKYKRFAFKIAAASGMVINRLQRPRTYIPPPSKFL